MTDPPACAPSPIRFGTSGWRGILGEEFTLPRARAVVRGVAEWVSAGQPGARVLVAHDTRLLGERLACEAASVLAAAGLRVGRARGPVPTPALAHAVRRRRAAAGLVFTASHNPPEYQGLKLVTRTGAAAPPEVTREIETRARAWLGREPPRAVAKGAVEILEAYRADLLGRLDVRVLRGSGLQVIHDALHGAGAGVLDAVLGRAGVSVRVRRGEPDPGFGGESPDPEGPRLTPLAAELRQGRGLRLGVATDGDGDRFAVVDAGGRILDASEALALLLDHLIRTGRVEKGVVLASPVGSLPELVAEWHGLRVERVPVGFKHLARAVEAGRLDAAGDESGGFAFGGFGLDKDGILSAALFAELSATLGAPLGRRLSELTRKLGPHAWGRRAVPTSPAARERLLALEASPPQRVGRAAVRSVDAGDGLRLTLGDGFLHWRASGTEPLIRIYAEADSQPVLETRLRAGERLLGGGWRRVGASR
ncbi:MAG: phosphoglucomutase/phosphomannomutase family protein [Myxococcota bacterium]